MKIFKLLSNRIFIFGTLLLIQVIWLILFFSQIVKQSLFFRVFSLLISILATMYIINKDDESGYKLIWIVVIMLLPLFGGILYLCFGNKRPSRYLSASIDYQLQQSYKCIEDNHVLDTINDEHIKGQMAYLVKEHYPVYANATTKYYSLGDYNFPDLLEALKKAKHFIFMEYFIVEEGTMFNQILDILKQKVQEGVEVRFMYDDVGTLTMLPYHYYKKLQSYGIKCCAFNKFKPIISVVMNNRDHRKITVIDGIVGFSGGINLADEYINAKVKYGHWKDTGIKVEGDAVMNLTLMFLTTWNAINHSNEDFTKYHPRNYKSENNGSGYVIPYGDSPLDNEPIGENVYLNIINQAKNYLYIFTPYLILNEKLQTALILASKRGVDVRICTPGIPDKKLVFQITRSYYSDLINQGIRIYEYTPGFMHAKNFVCDDEVATVGTINMDYRSLFLHFECGVYLYKCDTIKDIKKDFLDTISVSKEITKDDLATGRFRNFISFCLRLFAPLL